MEQPEALVAKNEVSRTVVMGEGEEQTGEEGPSVMKALPQDKVDLWSILAFQWKAESWVNLSFSVYADAKIVRYYFDPVVSCS